MERECTTAQRLQQIMAERNLRQADILMQAKPYCERFGVKLNKSDLSQFVSGKVAPGQWKLTILALTLKVSEAWLMGLDVPQEMFSWEESFRSNLSKIIPTYDEQDFAAAGLNKDKLWDVANGNMTLTLSLACQIADALGESLDKMTGNKNMPTPEAEDGLTEQESLFLSLIRRLTEDQKDFLLAQLKTLIEQEK